MHNSISVRESLARRGMSVDTDCPLCNIAVESVAHAFRDCHIVKAVCYQLGVCQSNSNFFTQDLRNWLKSNATAKSNESHRGLHWNILFPFAIWLIWKHRNQVVFKNRGANPALANMIIMQATKFFHCVSDQRNNRRLVIKQVRWERPGEGWLKLNTNGAANAMMNSAGAGGVVRGDKGNWVVGFSRRNGNTNSFAAEAWGLRDGLLLCNQMNLNDIIIELDLKALVDAINNPSYANYIAAPLVDDCRHLASRFSRLCFRHIYHEANMCVDSLAKLGLIQSLDFVIHSSLPVDSIASLEADSQGSFVNRACPALCSSV